MYFDGLFWGIAGCQWPLSTNPSKIQFRMVSLLGPLSGMFCFLPGQLSCYIDIPLLLLQLHILSHLQTCLILLLESYNRRDIRIHDSDFLVWITLKCDNNECYCLGNTRASFVLLSTFSTWMVCFLRKEVGWQGFIELHKVLGRHFSSNMWCTVNDLIK